MSRVYHDVGRGEAAGERRMPIARKVIFHFFRLSEVYEAGVRDASLFALLALP